MWLRDKLRDLPLPVRIPQQCCIHLVPLHRPSDLSPWCPGSASLRWGPGLLEGAQALLCYQKELQQARNSNCGRRLGVKTLQVHAWWNQHNLNLGDASCWRIAETCCPSNQQKTSQFWHNWLYGSFRFLIRGFNRLPEFLIALLLGSDIFLEFRRKISKSLRNRYFQQSQDCWVRSRSHPLLLGNRPKRNNFNCRKESNSGRVFASLYSQEIQPVSFHYWSPRLSGHGRRPFSSIYWSIVI